MNKLCNGQIKTNSEFLMKILQNYIWKCGYYGICYLVPYYLQLLTCNVSEEITKFEITYTFILQKNGVFVTNWVFPLRFIRFDLRQMLVLSCFITCSTCLYFVAFFFIFVSNEDIPLAFLLFPNIKMKLLTVKHLS